MIFWIEKEINVSYEKLIDDLNNDNPQSELSGYMYFLTLLKILCEGQIICSIESLIQYLEENKDTLYFQIQTSGTTSVPKSIKVKVSNCIRYVKKSKVDSLKIWGMGYPCGSFASTQVFFQSLINKETIYYIFGIDFKTADQIFSKYKITNLSCTPTFLSMLLINLKKEYESILKITTGGEKIKNSLINAMKNTFPSAEYINIYATTETGSLLYSTNEFFSIPEKYLSQLKIEEGTLRVHKCLLNAVERTNDDWYDTNDLVEFVGEQQFKFVSRSNGYLNTGGFRVSPSQIEEWIMEIDGVKDVHVYGRENSLLGSIICADIIGEGGVSPKSIKTELINKSIEKHMIPQIIRIVDLFEHVQNGKKKIMI
jgi:acyl-coenzyme A synthetase/AMP-(fatty) acid ligase